MDYMIGLYDDDHKVSIYAVALDYVAEEEFILGLSIRKPHQADHHHHHHLAEWEATSEEMVPMGIQ